MSSKEEIEEKLKQAEEDSEIQKKTEDLKKKLVLSGDPEAILDAKKILEENKDKFRSKEAIEEENQDLREKLSLAAQVAFEKKKAELGCSDSEIDTPDKLLAWEKGKSGKDSSSPSGSAPLQSNYFEQFKGKPEGGISKKKFASHSEMVKFLKVNEEDPEARKYIEALWKQTIQAMKNGEKIEYNPQTDLKNESSQPVEVRLTGKERNDPNSELQQFLARANAKWRESKTRESERKKEVDKS
jgi:hypothetical protein